VFISLEGIDGSGKTTQARLLADALGDGTLLVREPGGTPAAERVRALLADAAVELDPLAELLLFCAARADLTRRVIRPALERGEVVIADRFADSSVAYQGAARGLGTELVRQLSEAATGGLVPDLTLVIRVDPKTAAKRSRGADRFEAEGLDFQLAVADAYERIAATEPRRVVGIDGEGTVEQVHARVMETVAGRTGRP
jgi:dTMP kinase